MRYTLAALLLLLALAFPGAALSQGPRSVVLATHNLCPYGCYDEKGTFDGSAVQAVRHAFQQMNIPVSIVVVPWQQAQQMARKGQADGFFAASQNSRRDSEGIMSAVIADQKWNWYLLRESRLDPASPDFKGQAKVGGFSGANMLKWLQDNNYNVVGTPPNTEGLADMLLAQRLDAILANNKVMDEIVRKRQLHGVFRSVTLLDKPLGVYFSNRFLLQYPDFLKEFNKHVLEYRKENP
ncbi:substrate-binding periplasmic protein [Salidesulfovibrio onnuriiensis]|uniref:substrate-binding periplasmic protein n=1 Tax=Salidesulfovibrio onnuriiensis TaxID=2583823 RepID=UPI0011C7FB91|nr:transporter substrate-binding domain-containing protein [Salidesulfovibrio onnuriiensis]